MINFKGEFKSSKGNLYTVSIYNDAYTGAVIPLTITNVSINRGNSGIFDPVISSGCKVEFINNLLPAQLAGIFENYEKTYLCEVTTIDYNDSSTITIFKGWLAVDIIEQGLEYRPNVSLEFVDYLKKLDEVESELINGDIVNVGELFNSCLSKTVITLPIVYNTSIHSNNTVINNTSNYFKDNYIDTNNILKNSEKDNCKSTINKLLNPFNSYLYSWNGNYEVQNHIDIDNNASRNWLKYNSGVYTNVPTQKTELVEGVDFDALTDGVLNYESGVKEYKLNLKQQLYNNLVYNNFSNYYAISDNFPNITSGKWAVNLNGDVPTDFTTGNGYFDIGFYYKFDNQALFTHQNAHWNTIYNFDINYQVAKKFKITLDKSNTPQNQISIKAKVGKFKNITYNANQTYALGYVIKVQGGVNNGKFIGLVNGNSALVNLSTNNIPQWLHYATGTYKAYQNTIEVTDTVDINNLIDVNNDGITSDSLFGSENDVTLIIYFTTYFLLNKSTDTTGVQNTQIVGNIEVKYTSSIQDNTLIGTIGGNFTKKVDNSIYFFDTNNCNYSNSLLYSDGVDYQRTTGWIRDNITGDTYKPLANRLIGDVFSFYAKTRKKISISIWTDKQVKPLSILTFNNIDNKYFVTKINHDLGSDIYKVEANELDYEEINII